MGRALLAADFRLDRELLLTVATAHFESLDSAAVRAA